MNKYVKAPECITYSECKKKNSTLSSSRYIQLQIKNKNVRELRTFLIKKLSNEDLGSEIGSLSYVKKSTHYFLRTKALQDSSFIPVITSESALPMIPKDFINKSLSEGDLIISKDSNIGEAVILDRDYHNYMLSGAIYRLPVDENWKYYVFAFIKNDLFREQLDFLVPKGATLRHAKTLFLDCKIPLPNKNEKLIVEYISAITKQICKKEKLIIENHKKIMKLIDDEINNNQLDKEFEYKLPTYKEVSKMGRLDSGMYSDFYKKKIFTVLNYKNGNAPLTEQGLELIPGPSLEIKILGTRIDSDKYIHGFNRLITPKQITNYGTVKFEKYIGTPYKIKNIKFGDILFGESGTGRTMVFLDNDNITINNAHAHILRDNSLSKDSLPKLITIRSILQYYKEIGITDCMTVGGSGGHLSPSYFNRIYIPNFPKSTQEKITMLYYGSDLAYNPSEFLEMNDFIKYDNEYNSKVGIYELDKTAKFLKNLLDNAISRIANDEDIVFFKEDK